MRIIKFKKSRNWREIVGILLLATLLITIIFSIIRIVTSPSGVIDTDMHTKLKSDYVLMLVQCILGLFVMMIPSIIERRLSVDIPNTMETLYYIFLFCAVYLGEIQNFYYLIPHWDTILHAFSAAMLGALGFSLVNMLNNVEQLEFNLNPLFVSLFAFCFALAVGAMWEIIEYSFDGLMTINMQKFALQDGTLLVGHQALSDTMYDIIVDAVSALITSVIGYNSIKKHNDTGVRHFMGS